MNLLRANGPMAIITKISWLITNKQQQQQKKKTKLKAFSFIHNIQHPMHGLHLPLSLDQNHKHKHIQALCMYVCMHIHICI